MSVYRSADLHTWQFRKNVLTEASAPELRAADASLWRPEVIYNARTEHFVMWMRKGSKPNAKDSAKGRVAVAMSRTVDGTYTYKGSFRPLGIMSYDTTVFCDDGTAYLIATTAGQKDLTIFRLTPDYLGVAAKLATRGAVREGAVMFKRKGVYFLVASGVRDRDPHHRTLEPDGRLRRQHRPWLAVFLRPAGAGQQDDLIPLPGRSARTSLGPARQRLRARLRRGKASVLPGSQRQLTFDHQQAVQIPRGGERNSDPLVMRTAPLEILTVTLYFDGPTGPATYHRSALAASYLANSEHGADQTSPTSAKATRS
ncbi:family 43 glycosylhydrolase [Streptomyces sp. NPDC059680]|uniref:family 43 glycosylhydrolase n=1 Tax=Streptomyces sp. NPDC059680 TaxID=3346904 RepID=UPI0036B602F4